MQHNLFYCYDNAEPLLDNMAARLRSACNDTIAEAALINQDGGIKAWIVPRYTDRRHYAYNPIIFRSVNVKYGVFEWEDIPAGADTVDIVLEGQTVTCYTDPAGTDDVRLELYTLTGTEPVTLVSTERGGTATFNAAPIARTFLADRLIVSTEAVIADPMLASWFRVRDLDGAGTFWAYFIQNAVSQTGSDGDKSFGSPVLVNDNTRLLKWYYNEEMEYWEPIALPEVTVLNATRTTLTLGGRSYTLEAKTAYRIKVSGPDDVAAINAYIGETLLTLEERNLSGCSPAAVRWLNRKGGVDCHVFTGRQFKTKTAKTTGILEQYVERPGESTGNMRAYALQGERRMRVGSDGVDDYELDYLTRLPYSPYIQWYDLANELWTHVVVQEFENEERTDGPQHPYEIDLLCPSINMQFD